MSEGGCKTSRSHLSQRRGLSDKKHVDDAEVFDDAHPREKRQRRHLHHRHRAAPERAAGAQRARSALGQRAGALQGRDWRFTEFFSTWEKKGVKRGKAEREEVEIQKINDEKKKQLWTRMRTYDSQTRCPLGSCWSVCVC